MFIGGDGGFFLFMFLLLLLQIKTSSCALRRRASGCSVGPAVTKRNGTRSSVTTVVWGSCWSAAAGSCRAD